jgi:hypothetical protein
MELYAIVIGFIAVFGFIIFEYIHYRDESLKEYNYSKNITSNLNTKEDSISFEAVLSKKSLGINEKLRVDFKINKDGDNFTPPNFTGFKVVGGPNQSVSNMWVNGKRTFSKIYSYFLCPIKKGSVTIGKATIEIDKKIYKTLTVKISVSESVSISNDPSDPNYVVNENLYLLDEISNSGAIFEGEYKNVTFIESGKVIDKNGNIDRGKWENNSFKKKNNTKPPKNILKEKFFEINRVYRKSDIYKIFNVPKVQQGGKWRNGYCEHNNEFFIFANIGIPGKTDAGEYDYKNKINDNDEMEWEAQNGSKLSWPTVQKLKKSNPYIFVRYKDFRSGIYKFIGVGDCMETMDTSPVYFKWRICDYKESNDIDKKNEFIEVISAVNQFKKIKDKEEKKPIERTTKKIPSSNNIAQEKTKLLDKDLLKEIFYNFVKKTFNIYKREENPFKIKYIHSKALKISYWVFLKNISPAHLSNPDISRIQVENKPVFKEIDEKKELCIPIGYDSINKVFVVWNPDLFLKRILNKRNISIYSRFSDQTNLTESFKEFELTNDEKVFIVNSNFISIFLKNIRTYFKINNNISESSSKQSNISLLPGRTYSENLTSSKKELFKYLSDVDILIKSGEVLKAVQIIYETHKDNKDFKDYKFKDWFDLITQYKNNKF